MHPNTAFAAACLERGTCYDPRARSKMPAKSLQQSGGGTPISAISVVPSSATPAVQQTGGNGAAQDKLKKVTGPIGRVWNHILGQAEGRTDTGDAAIDQAMVRAYLDKRLGFAEGEYFRGTKLDGVAEKLVSTFDKDGDGKVNWSEFQAFESQIFAMLAPGADKPGVDAGAAAGAQFGKIDQSGDKQANLAELQATNQAGLPAGTDHADLVAQLGARVAIDAADRDQAGTPVGQRSLSRDEWTAAATETANHRR
jgi:hypothetical protein